jgi:sugar transferase (PEP-CTERM system associated)
VTRILAQVMPLEMALLGLVELLLSYLLIHAMLSTPDVLDLFRVAPPNLSRDCTILAAMLSLTIGGTAATIGLYRPEVCLDRKLLLLSATVAGLVAFPAVLLVSGGLHVRLGPQQVFWMAKVLAIWLSGTLAIRIAFSRVIRHNRFSRRVLIIGTGEGTERIVAMLRARRGRRFETVLTNADRPVLSAGDLQAQRIWGVVTVDRSTSLPGTVLLDSKLRGIRVFDETTFHEQQLGRINLDTITADWMLLANGFTNSRTYGVLKRGLDIVVSLLLLFLTLPLVVITALLVKLESQGPVLYRQQRVGLHGAPFTLLKFRSMKADAEFGGIPRWAQKSDPRVTRVGTFIRMTRIDELPQLLNVLTGEMSMIGPRPERPHFVEQLGRAIPFYHERAYVKPGITGWAQVNFPYGASIEDAREKLAFDLYYVKNRNLLLDMLILVSTVRVILFREGAR